MKASDHVLLDKITRKLDYKYRDKIPTRNKWPGRDSKRVPHKLKNNGLQMRQFVQLSCVV